MTLQVEGLRWHDPISVVGAPSRSECYGVVAPPRSWGRGIRNAAHPPFRSPSWESGLRGGPVPAPLPITLLTARAVRIRHIEVSE